MSSGRCSTQPGSGKLLPEFLISAPGHQTVLGHDQCGDAGCSSVHGQHAHGTSVVPCEVGVLTGGGDCPGLNAVIRALVRRGTAEFGYEFVGFPRRVARGRSKATPCPWMYRRYGGSCRGAGRSSARRAPTPWPRARRAGGRSGVERIKDNLSGLGVDALVVIGGEDTLGVATRPARGRPPSGRGAEDHRQRPGRHGLHVRLRHPR